MLWLLLLLFFFELLFLIFFGFVPWNKLSILLLFKPLLFWKVSLLSLLISGWISLILNRYSLLPLFFGPFCINFGLLISNKSGFCWFKFKGFFLFLFLLFLSFLFKLGFVYLSGLISLLIGILLKPSSSSSFNLRILLLGIFLLFLLGRGPVKLCFWKSGFIWLLFGRWFFDFFPLSILLL